MARRDTDIFLPKRDLREWLAIDVVERPSLSTFLGRAPKRPKASYKGPPSGMRRRETKAVDLRRPTHPLHRIAQRKAAEDRARRKAAEDRARRKAAEDRAIVSDAVVRLIRSVKRARQLKKAMGEA